MWSGGIVAVSLAHTNY